MKKVKRASVKIVKPNTIHTIKVLGETVYIMENQTILRIGNTTKTIEGSRMFSLLDKKIQEFTVHLVLCLVKSKAKGNNKYFKVDKMALDFITEKYPKKPKQFWYSAFTTLLIKSSDSDSTELNRQRVEKFYKHITKNK
jgi:hypothetical protein